MSYMQWFMEHDQKHHLIVEKLKRQNFTKEQIIDYFVFENMVKVEPNFCLLYENKKKCHDIIYLNCYLCACPHFRFNDEGIETKEAGFVVKSECSIHSKNASKFTYEKVEHLDCSKCILPHTHIFVKKYFDEVWQKMMKDCFLHL